MVAQFQPYTSNSPISRLDNSTLYASNSAFLLPFQFSGLTVRQNHPLRCKFPANTVRQIHPNLSNFPCLRVKNPPFRFKFPAFSVRQIHPYPSHSPLLRPSNSPLLRVDRVDKSTATRFKLPTFTATIPSLCLSAFTVKQWQPYPTDSPLFPDKQFHLFQFSAFTVRQFHPLRTALTVRQIHPSPSNSPVLRFDKSTLTLPTPHFYG